MRAISCAGILPGQSSPNLLSQSFHSHWSHYGVQSALDSIKYYTRVMSRLDPFTSYLLIYGRPGSHSSFRFFPPLETCEDSGRQQGYRERDRLVIPLGPATMPVNVDSSLFMRQESILWAYFRIRPV